MSICVDASLVLKWLTYEPGSDEALVWLNMHASDEIIAPSFLSLEVASVLRQKTRRAEMTSEESLEALHLLDKLKIRFMWDWTLLERALELAIELDQSTAYDTAYLALAEREECELWTADACFARAASPRYPIVRLLTPHPLSCDSIGWPQ
ncbi:MAG: type II toxin-antitoxin system VapC family toxin [Firmicutes bacterium]|nr:type II toxin-antitoxin system VapC family toxin [Bacillota bacterium]